MIVALLFFGFLFGSIAIVYAILGMITGIQSIINGVSNKKKETSSRYEKYQKIFKYNP